MWDIVFSCNFHIPDPFLGSVWRNLEEEHQGPQVVKVCTLAMPLVACGRDLGENVFLAESAEGKARSEVCKGVRARDDQAVGQQDRVT